MNSTIIKRIAVCVYLSVICAGCVDDPTGSLVNVGDELPQFGVSLSDGLEYTSARLAAHGGIILFFNTGCEDCRRELPLWQQYYDDTHCEMICISREEAAASVAAYWDRESLTMPWSAQTDRRVYNLFALSGIPRAYVIAPGGTVTAVCEGPPDTAR